MTYNLEDLPALDEGFGNFEIQWGWICHACKIITLVSDWDLSWNNFNNNNSEICSNEACKHVRCEFCRTTSSLDLSFQQDYSFAAEAVLGNAGLMGQSEDLESFEATWKSRDPQPLPIEAQVSTVEQLLKSPDVTKLPASTGNVPLDSTIQDFLSPNPSEGMMAAILKDLLGTQDDPEGPDISGNGKIDPFLEHHTTPAAFKAQSADPLGPPPPPKPSPSPPSSTPSPHQPLPLPPPPRQRLVPCPCQHTHSCTRTFQLTHHATRHAQIHTHPYPCPALRCASRFTTVSSLRAHTTRIHSPLHNISDLDERFKGPLVADVERDGKYPCRFREVLGCERRFGQNGHANRHSLGHCKRTWKCGAVGCRLRFVVRENWEWHRWSVHAMMPWD